jgi:hypothetical protein
MADLFLLTGQHVILVHAASGLEGSNCLEQIVSVRFVDIAAEMLLGSDRRVLLSG